MRLLVIDLPEHDAAINLQLDDSLLTLGDADYILRFWINDPAVILGKFQKAAFEINTHFLLENSIPYFHRNTGGGTVYHDRGTLNITFIKPRLPVLNGAPAKKESRLITECIRLAIRHPGVDLHISDRNAIYHGNSKLLGSAVSLTGGKFRYHASLLVQTDLQRLRNSLNWQPEYPADDKKLVQSHRDPVTNLNDLYPVTIDTIKEQMIGATSRLVNPDHIVRMNSRNHLDKFYKVNHDAGKVV